jgi:plastocyanin
MNTSSDHKEPPVLTPPGRITRGVIIVGVTLAIGGAILLTFFDQMTSNPPPVTQIRRPPPPGEPPQTGGPTVISILSGASVQGSPDYDPDNANVPLGGPGSEIVWDNLDTVPHTATSGTGPSDPESGALFDTGILNPDDNSDNIVLEGVNEGDVIDYYCILHIYMTGKLTIVTTQDQGTAGDTDGESPAGGGPPSGATLNILEGSSVQGSPDFDPDSLTVKKGDKINVVNQDTAIHTVTDGVEPGAASGKLFDTGLLNPGKSTTLDTSSLNPGTFDYFCQVHPFMKGKLTVE